ncbi:hypothetical protein TRFO_04773 [Tritrichomonas foetus]|uniref:Right handed beta helix domain-containing protein n=1 Tax=Tritrichomonas foetus TaxID=1144522 RepID=A0A1J4KH82_9EUKA|nr:hypothetical protein TRFO_04773 [Tritrichomonas foetus]|eukprot:OHT08701.1 hypothetical protein TRFO_04773 [Tritrichomonas foetus]
MGSFLLNLTILNLFSQHQSSHSPFLLSLSSKQNANIINCGFSNFISPIIFNAKFFTISQTLFSNFIESPIKASTFQAEENIYTDPLIIEHEESNISIIKCFFNHTSSRNNGGAIEFLSNPSKINIYECSFQGCFSNENDGIFNLDFASVVNISNCCFFDCYTKYSKKSNLFSISSSSSLVFDNNIISNCGESASTLTLSSSYSISIKSSTILMNFNNFTKNNGNFISFDSSNAINSKITKTSIINSTTPKTQSFIRGLKNNNVNIEECNIVSNNLEGSAFFSSATSGIKILNTYFLKNQFLEFVVKGESSRFTFNECILDFQPDFTIGTSNIVIEGETNTHKIDFPKENQCLTVTTSPEPNQKRSWTTVGIFMGCGVFVIILILIGLFFILRGKGGRKFLAIAEVPSGYQNIYDLKV